MIGNVNSDRSQIQNVSTAFLWVSYYCLVESSWTGCVSYQILVFLNLTAPIQSETIPSWIKGNFAENKHYYAEWWTIKLLSFTNSNELKSGMYISNKLRNSLKILVTIMIILMNTTILIRKISMTIMIIPMKTAILILILNMLMLILLLLFLLEN